MCSGFFLLPLFLGLHSQQSPMAVRGGTQYYLGIYCKEMVVSYPETRYCSEALLKQCHCPVLREGAAQSKSEEEASTGPPLCDLLREDFIRA